MPSEHGPCSQTSQTLRLWIYRKSQSPSGRYRNEEEVLFNKKKLSKKVNQENSKANKRTNQRKIRLCFVWCIYTANLAGEPLDLTSFWCCARIQAHASRTALRLIERLRCNDGQSIDCDVSKPVPTLSRRTTPQTPHPSVCLLGCEESKWRMCLSLLLFHLVRFVLDSAKRECRK